MALCPFAEQRTGGINNGGRRGHALIGVTVHHMDGYWQGAESRFRDPSSDASAAFGIRFDGSIIQWLDTDLVDYHACMAQWEGWLGIENESHPDQPDAPPTAEQIASMGRLIAWLGVPAVPATSRTGGGVGYHRQFPGPCGAAWGQTACPGQGFIDSIPAICAAAGAAPAPTPTAHAPLEAINMVTVMFDKNGVDIWRLGDTRRKLKLGEWNNLVFQWKLVTGQDLKPFAYDQTVLESVPVAA